MNLSPFSNPREHACLKNKKESFSMQSQRSSSRIGAILGLLGGALVIYSMFFLPMFFGNGVSSADVPNFELNYNSYWMPFAVLLTLSLLSVLFVLGTSAASFFRELSPRIVTWRRIAALAGLIIQGLVGFVGATLYSFSLPPHLGAGYWLVLLGFMAMSVGAFLK
jgi:hypothetical protein